MGRVLGTAGLPPPNRRNEPGLVEGVDSTELNEKAATLDANASQPESVAERAQSYYNSKLQPAIPKRYL